MVATLKSPPTRCCMVRNSIQGRGSSIFELTCRSSPAWQFGRGSHHQRRRPVAGGRSGIASGRPGHRCEPGSDRIYRAVAGYWTNFFGSTRSQYSTRQQPARIAAAITLRVWSVRAIRGGMSPRSFRKRQLFTVPLSASSARFALASPAARDRLYKVLARSTSTSTPMP